MRQIPHLKELRASFEEKGLRILAISKEPPEKLKPFIEERGITYPVGIAKAWDDYGSGGIPRAYLIDPSGEVVWTGHPAGLKDSTIEKHLRKTKDFWIRDVHPAVRSAASAFEKGKMTDAAAKAKELRSQEGAERRVITDADHVLARVTAVKAFFQGRADAAFAIGDYDKGIDHLERIEKYFAGSDDADAAAKKIAELEKDPEVKKEMAASKKLRKLENQIERAGDSKKKLLSVEKKVVKFMDKHEGMKVADRARQLLRVINRAKADAR